jgi:hypothetical protein
MKTSTAMAARGFIRFPPRKASALETFFLAFSHLHDARRGVVLVDGDHG